MGLITLLFQNPAAFFILVVLLLYSVIFHEVAHGLVALFFGDKTAQYSGRLTLNPKVHVDPVGALMLLFVGFGWAKPVPVSYANLKHFRIGLVCVAFAGCLANIIMATFALILIQFQIISDNRMLFEILYIFAKINIALGAFNLIPIPPLDGSKILMGFLPEKAQYGMVRFESFGYVLLILLIITHTLDPIITFFNKAIMTLIIALLHLQ